METTRTERFKTTILVLATAGLISGLAICFAGRTDIADFIWIAGIVPALAAADVGVAVILNALRALRIAPHEPATPKPQAFSSGRADAAQGATP